MAELDAQLKTFKARPEKAAAFLAEGESIPRPSIDQAELAAYAVVARILLNLDETLTKE